MILGFESLQQRAPSWERGAHYTNISRNGFGLQHCRDRSRDAAVGSPKLKEGDLYSFCFAVLGGGAGVVVGVADANFFDAESAEQIGGAWGINLSHGALFSKKSFVDRGELHSQQILPIPTFDRSTEHHIDNIIEVEVEVDMRRKPYRIAFGLPNEPMVHASTAEINCDAVRPWAYLWGHSDAVVLLPRRRPKVPRMQTWKHAIRASLSFRAGEGTGAFRGASIAASAAQRLWGEQSTIPTEADDDGGPKNPILRAALAAAAPARRQLKEDDSAAVLLATGTPASLGGGGEGSAQQHQGREGAQGASGAVAQHPLGGTQSTQPPQQQLPQQATPIQPQPPPHHANTSTPHLEEQQQQQQQKQKQGQRVASRAILGRKTPARAKMLQKSLSLSAIARERMLTNAKVRGWARDGDYTYYDDPKRTRLEDLKPSLLEFSEREFEEARQAGEGARTKRHPWDRARPVTRTYSDFWGQQF
jgi:hypothetical protein